jgi:hypothetical protein
MLILVAEGCIGIQVRIKVEGKGNKRFIAGSGLILSGLLLSACGGGSGGDGSPATSASSSSSSASSTAVVDEPDFSNCFSGIDAGNSSAYLFPIPQSIALAEYTSSGSSNQQTIKVSLQNFPAPPYFIAARYSLRGLASIKPVWNIPKDITFSVAFKLASTLMPGVYSDMLQIELYRDGNCNTRIDNSFVSIPFTYKVIPATGSGSPTISFDRQSIDASVSHVGPSRYISSGLSTDISLSLSNFAYAPYVSATVQGTALSSATATATSTSGKLSISFASPGILQNGSYTGVVSLKVCLDGFVCLTQAPGSPFQIPVSYNVSDMAWDANSLRIYATTVSSTFTSGALNRIDPVTKAIDWSLALPAVPRRVVISPDGAYAYLYTTAVAGDNSESDFRLRKYRLSDRSEIWSIPLADKISDLKVSPGTGAYLVVSSSSPDIALFSTASGVLIDHATSSSGFPESVSWGSSDTALYSYDATNDLLREFSPTPLSIGFKKSSNVDLNTDQQAWAGLHYGNGLLMENHGAIYNPSSAQITSRLNIRTAADEASFKPYSIATALDMSLGRSYFWYLSSGGVVMQVFDMNTGMPLAYFSSSSRSTFRLIRWGSNGLAYLHSENSSADSGIALVQGKFVAP